MRLKQLKLAGFKSFVEPTVITFPSQLVAVVGPNGCGKSNVMDSVRWVMGESSARNLRMEAMADVIFNGSTNRKPVGQASVELIFENNKGRLEGQYASYQEISIKRRVTRDGESTYFLNGTRCRRRDISDIFLGTGAGARGYAIIGQDMIARLIEAKPEELRAFLEEAAGVSKYKERRRETLSRINHTRENLERVNDIREELGKQIERLERQAKAAQRYKDLRQQERQLKGEIVALKWRALHEQEEAIQKNLNQDQIIAESAQAKIYSFENALTQQQEIAYEAEQNLQIAREQYYQIGNEIARLEASIQQKQHEKQRIKSECADIETEVAACNETINKDNEELEAGAKALDLLLESLESIERDYNDFLQVFQEKQNQLKVAQKEWHEFEENKQKLSHSSDKLKLQKEHLDARKQDICSQIEKMHEALTDKAIDELEYELGQLEMQLEASMKAKQKVKGAHEDAQEKVKALRQELFHKEEEWRSSNQKLQKFITEHAALVAAQQAALQSNSYQITSPKWQSYQKLIDSMDVAPEWTHAFELVLNDGLHAVLINSLEELSDEWATLIQHPCLFVTSKNSKNSTCKYPTLREKLKGVVPSWVNELDTVLAAENINEALSWLPHLAENQSIITKDGMWLGHGWVKVIPPNLERDEASLLARKESIQLLEDKIKKSREETEQLEAAIELLNSKLEPSIAEVEHTRIALSEENEQYNKLLAHKNHKQEMLAHSKQRQDRLNEERYVLEVRLEEIAQDQLDTEAQLVEVNEKLAGLLTDEHRLLEQKMQCDSDTGQVGHQLEAVKHLLHETQLKKDREALQCNQLKERIERENKRLVKVKSRLTQLVEQLKKVDMPDEELKRPLEEKNNQYLELETRLQIQRENLQSIKNEIETLHRSKQDEEKQLKQIQDNIQKRQLEEQTLKVKQSNLIETLEESELTLKSLLDELCEDISLDEREQTLQIVLEKINRLGAINLIAIEEYQSELERKKYLDEQHQDLSEALLTLEQAIHKMDKETETRLRETFDEVNASFQSLFPRLFGGGRAKLELTCDNLLEAGVLVTAQPPGKRNSTIHMLSGGEKSMTAIALVFAIFQLNPAPFCLLDEVDAPLDDANVRRFTDLVKEMSEYVQFLFITHNKVTMELADQLIGVTMREPGVSRIVAVDVEEALNIAES